MKWEVAAYSDRDATCDQNETKLEVGVIISDDPDNNAHVNHMEYMTAGFVDSSGTPLVNPTIPNGVSTSLTYRFTKVISSDRNRGAFGVGKRAAHRLSGRQPDVGRRPDGRRPAARVGADQVRQRPARRQIHFLHAVAARRQPRK